MVEKKCAVCKFRCALHAHSARRVRVEVEVAEGVEEEGDRGEDVVFT